MIPYVIFTARITYCKATIDKAESEAENIINEAIRIANEIKAKAEDDARAIKQKANKEVDYIGNEVKTDKEYN